MDGANDAEGGLVMDGFKDGWDVGNIVMVGIADGFEVSMVGIADGLEDGAKVGSDEG